MTAPFWRNERTAFALMAAAIFRLRAKLWFQGYRLREVAPDWFCVEPRPGCTLRVPTTTVGFHFGGKP